MGRCRVLRSLGAATLLVAAVTVPSRPAAAGEVEDLRRELDEMRRQMQRLEEAIRGIERQKGTAPAPAKPPLAAPAAPAAKPADADAALDRALAEAKAAAPAERPSGASILARPVGGAQLRLIDVSFDILFAAGGSTANDEQLSFLEGGAHDPNQRGFTLQQTELSFVGAIDPYFTGEAHIVFVPDGVELEEAFFTTTALPYGLQLKAGHFFTEFGRINAIHPHAWDWMDQPIIATRLFGGDGQRDPGFRLGWLTPLPWFSEVYLGAQDASGETMPSFFGEEGEETTIGDRPVTDQNVRNLGDFVYLSRWDNAWSLTDTLTAKLGGSALFGPNATGRQTYMYGTDLVLKWRPADNFRGWPFVTWQTEAMWRDFLAAGVPAEPGSSSLPATTLHDGGLYTQVNYGFLYGWAAGLRFEYVNGSGESVGGRDNDPFRDRRLRVSPLLTWYPSEFSRIRLQYNYDNVDRAPVRDASSVWLGFEVLYGAHPAHKF